MDIIQNYIESDYSNESLRKCFGLHHIIGQQIPNERALISAGTGTNWQAANTVQ